MRVKLAALIALGGLVFVLQAFAYSPFYTHPDLTEEMARLFNLKNLTEDLNISAKEIQWLRTGAINEDDAPRWINHFYDPTNKAGWSGKHFGTLTPEEGLKFGADFAPKPPMASVDWVVDQESQALYGNQQGNQTWQKAVKSFIDGDKKSAFIALGHVLHLLEDASVPDHTRDDTHADLFGDPGSPYEKYSREYTNANRLNLAADLKNTDFLNFSNIQEAIKSLAIYSNNYFFSEDTINNEDFNKPALNFLETKLILINNKEKKALFNPNSNIYLALENKSNKFTLDDKIFVLPSYRDHLFPKAVLTGASVINLFFKDVEYYKQHPEQLEPIVSDVRQPLATAIKNSPKRIAIKIADTASRIGADITKITTKTALALSGALNTLGIKLGFVTPLATSQSNTELTTPPAAQSTSPAPVNPPVTIAATQTPKPPAPVPKPKPAPVTVEDVLPPVPKPIPEPTVEFSTQPTTTPVVPLQPKPSYVLAVGYVPPAPSGNAEVVSPAVENVITIPDSASTSTTSTLEVATSTEDNVTSTEPVATSTISVTTTIEISTTTITTTTPETATSTPEISTSTISVTTTIDTTSTTTSTPAVEAGPPAVVINEVAWAGTSASKSNDEWFELYNNTDQEIDLTDWKIFVSGQQIKIKINNKIIAPRGYYLLERKEDLVIRDIGADAIFTGSLNNDGEKLEVFNPDGAKVDEVDASGGWFAGDKIKYRSMERLDPTKNGSDPANWQSAISYRPTGQNANYLQIYGSPRQSNFGFLVLHSSQEEDVKTLDIKNSPYVVQYYIIPAGKTLNVDPDVSVLLQIYGVMEVNGSLNALGEPDKRVNFLPYPSSSAWGSLTFNNSTSTLNFVNLKRGNRITHLPQNLNGMILANNSNLTINNSTLWDSETNTIGGADSILNISNTAIGATVKDDNTYGINTRGGVLNLDNVSFSNLNIGVEAGCSDCSHPELHKTNMSDANFTNVDYIAEPLSWWNVEEDEIDESDEEGGEDEVEDEISL